MVRRALLALCVAGCGARPHAGPAVATDEVTLYRDRALVRQRVELAVSGGGAAIALKVAAGLAADSVTILDRGELVVSELRIANAVADEPPRAARDADADADAGEAEVAEDPLGLEEPPAPRRIPVAPTELALVVRAPRDGRYALSVAYVTDRLAWGAAYTMTTTAARDRAVLRGAVAIRNTSGIVLRARTQLVDRDVGAWRERAAEQLAGAPADEAPAVAAVPRDLGVVTLGDGETRIELLAGDPPRALRSVLVYDPIGTRFDHLGAVPISAAAFGIESEAPTRVTESFEIDRGGRRVEGLPTGPVRWLERRGDGALAMLGAAQLFEPATRVASVDSIVIGTADGVVGHRERRDWAKDDDQKRFSEEFLITIDNARAVPVEVVIREHLYRGQNWTLAYQSAPAVKEGAQQIALRARVPARGQARVLYVVVYTW